MDWLETLREIDSADLQRWLEEYSQLGPLPGIFAPMLESFIPILPLLAILIANASAYGLWWGFLLSWIGVNAGCACVFLLSRRFGQPFRGYISRKFPKANRFFHYIETRGFTPIFVFSFLPFSPSFMVNMVSGISNVPFHTFMTAVVLGKTIMIFLVSLIGYDVFSLWSEPVRLILAAVLLVGGWLIGKTVESRYT